MRTILNSMENFCVIIVNRGAINYGVINREISNLFVYHSIMRHALVFLNYWLSNFVEFVFIHQTNIVYAPLLITEITDTKLVSLFHRGRPQAYHQHLSPRKQSDCIKYKFPTDHFIHSSILLTNFLKITVLKNRVFLSGDHCLIN